MLTMNEIEGEQQWTFRFRLEDAEDDYLHQLLEDARSLRRLLPPLLSLDDAHQVIHGLLTDRHRRRVEAERRERRRLARIAKAKLAAEKKAASPTDQAIAAQPSATAPDSAHEQQSAQQMRHARWTDMLYTFFGGNK